MAKVTVYRFKIWDVIRGEDVVSTRMGTREAIAGLRGATLIEGTGIDVDEALLGRGKSEPGLTDRDFDPDRSG